MIRLKDIFARRLEDALKTSSKRLEGVLKTSWKCLEDVFARRLEGVLKTSCRCLGKRSWRRLEDISKTSWRRLEDVWPRRIYWSWPKRLENVLKTSSEDLRLRWAYSSWSRRLEDVFKAPSEDEDEDVFIKMNVCWVNTYEKRDDCKCLFKRNSTVENTRSLQVKKWWYNSNASVKS